MVSSVGAGMDNDTRGWILCLVSGLACVFGAAIICVDIIVQYFPGKRSFRIQESSGFLACSLSLSFGVMLFSALYNMLPSSMQYLEKGGFGRQTAGLILMSCFASGFLGIQVVSRLLHQLIPSHVVDCDHSHDEAVLGSQSAVCGHRCRLSRSRSLRRKSSRANSAQPAEAAGLGIEDGHVHRCPSEGSPLLHPHHHHLDGKMASSAKQTEAFVDGNGDVGGAGAAIGQPPAWTLAASRPRASTLDRRGSMQRVQRRVVSFVKDTKAHCDELGPCYGYTDPCGQECFKHLTSRTSSHAIFSPPTINMLQTTTGPIYPSGSAVNTCTLHGADADCDSSPASPRFRISRAQSRDTLPCDLPPQHHHDRDCSSVGVSGSGHGDGDGGDEAIAATLSTAFDQHHHHVPTNAFMSIGLQTCIAIALHKFPEGFITYATNHANPTLGFNVFMALLVHNITEGFTMALPLYMALGSRLRALAWTAVLGGLSQPLGAAMAVLWFHLSRRSHLSPNAVFYACLFAVTAGIMVSVALQLFVESLSLNHNRNLCILFGFLGMMVLGLSGILVAGD